MSGAERYRRLRRYLTADEAAEYLRVAKGTLYHYTSRGIIPHIKLGNRLLFERDQIEAWLSARRRGGADVEEVA